MLMLLKFSLFERTDTLGSVGGGRECLSAEANEHSFEFRVGDAVDDGAKGLCTIEGAVARVGRDRLVTR